MKTFIRNLTGIGVVVLNCLMIAACKKNQPVCSGNCADIYIKGRVYNKLTGAGFANVPVEVLWIMRGSCFGCTSYNVANGNTATDGSFNFPKTIDSTFFKTYDLIIRIKADTNYLVAFPLSSSGYSLIVIDRRIDTLDQNALQQIKFEYYPKALLTARIHRVQSDVFSYFSIGGMYEPHSYTQYFSITGQQNAHDTTLRFTTAADIYTKIQYGKSLNGTQTSSATDSIICTQSGTNVIDINY